MVRVRNNARFGSSDCTTRPQRVRHGFRRAGGLHHDRKRPRRHTKIPRQRVVGLRHHAIAQPHLVHVADDADDSKLYPVDEDLADGTFVRPERLRHRAIDDRGQHVTAGDHFGFRGGLGSHGFANQIRGDLKIVANELAPLQQRNPHGAEVVRADGRKFDQRAGSRAPSAGREPECTRWCRLAKAAWW